MYGLKARWRLFVEWLAPPRRTIRLESDTAPKHMPSRNLVVLTEGPEDWSVVMLCPCGCGDRVELPLFAEAHPRWDLQIDSRGRPTVRPSIWRTDGCRAHYFVRAGRVIWV